VYVAPLIGHDAARRTEITIVPRRLHYMNEIDRSLEDQTVIMIDFKMQIQIKLLQTNRI
jgi:hypothetical protein